MSSRNIRRPWELALAAVVGLTVLGVGGCARPAVLTGSPPPVPRDSFAYKPIQRRSPSEVRAPAPLRPVPAVPKVAEPAIPSHDAAWEPTLRPRPWRWIVIHHSATDTGSAAVFDADHRNRRHWDELGYHFVIGNGGGAGDGTVEVGSRWYKQKHGAHCRVGDNEEYNNFGIGICLVGNFEKRRPSEAQMESLARLVDYLSALCRIDEAHIIGHGTVDDTRCPGRYFSFDDLLARLRQRRAAR